MFLLAKGVESKKAACNLIHAAFKNKKAANGPGPVRGWFQYAF